MSDTPSHAVKRYAYVPEYPGRMVPWHSGDYVTFSDYDQVRKQRDDLLEKSEWKPIESAPKDGTRVIAVSRGCDAHVHFWHQTDKAWWIEYADGRSWQPTHWMPLPNPFTIAAAEKEGK